MQVAYHHDILYGRPGPGMQKRMLAVIGDILAMDSWQAFWRMVGEPPGNPASSMTRYLRLCWKRSLAKGYHQEVRGSSATAVRLKSCPWHEHVPFHAGAARWCVYPCSWNPALRNTARE